MSEASLAKVVSNLRETLGHDEHTPIIRTVHGYGYAFAGSVVEGARADAVNTRAIACWLFCGRREFPLPDGEHIVGRDRDVSICLESPRVSRRHAKVTVSSGRAEVEDLRSKNGSFVLGSRIAVPTTLSSGDDIRIGPFTLIFRISADVGSTESER